MDKKLKTIKDLVVRMSGREREDSKISNLYDYMHVGPETEILWPGQLKQEAIRWIKELENDSFNYWFEKELLDLTDSGYEVFSSKRHGNIIFWIKHFFNISEEDLKEWE